MSDKNVYQRINQVMKDCDYLQKKGSQQGKGVKYDDVMAMIRQLLIDNGLVMVVRQTKMELIGGLDGKNQKVYQGHYEMDIINMDAPSEVVTHTAFAQGMDGGDKAAGKAHTYAVKIMLVKGFGIETGEDEESRAEKIDKKNLISSEQYEDLVKYCVVQGADGAEWSKTALKLFNAYHITDLNHLPASKFEGALERCKKAAK